MQCCQRASEALSFSEIALLLDSLAHLAVGEAGLGRVAATLWGSGPWRVSLTRSGQKGDGFRSDEEPRAEPAGSATGARHVEVDRGLQAPALDRDAGSREVLGEGRTAVARRADEPLEPAHRPCGQVVQHDERFGRSFAHLQRPLDPPVGKGPVAGDHVPEHAGIAALSQMLDRLLVEKAPVDHTATAGAQGPEEAARMGEIADQLLGARDLGSGEPGLGREPERHEMVVGVIANPVAFGVGALGESSAVTELVAKDEEGREDAVSAESREHERRDVRIGAVVEGQGNGGHWVILLGKGTGLLRR